MIEFLFEKFTFLSPQKNISCGYSKETSQRDCSFKHPKQMLKLMDKKLFTIYFMLEFLGFYFTLEFLGYVVKSQLECKYNSVSL